MALGEDGVRTGWGGGCGGASFGHKSHDPLSSNLGAMSFKNSVLSITGI